VPRNRRPAKCGYEFSPPDVDCHATLQGGSCNGGNDARYRLFENRPWLPTTMQGFGRRLPRGLPSSIDGAEMAIRKGASTTRAGRVAGCGPFGRPRVIADRRGKGTKPPAIHFENRRGPPAK
jgi:hypothetical protein